MNFTDQSLRDVSSEIPAAFGRPVRLMREAAASGVFPGGVLLLAKNGEVCLETACGITDLSSGTPVRLNTWFDLASLTKPLVTTLCVMLLVQRGLLRTSDRVAGYLPGFETGDRSGITIEHLLRHISGLPAHRPYHETLAELPVPGRRAALKGLVAKEPLIHPPGTRMVYSDLGFMVLGWIVEKLAGQPMDRFATENVFQPLSLGRLFFPGVPGDWDCKAAGLRPDVAATQDCPVRGKVLRGEVDDANAWFSGGVEGHAGLFGTAGDVGRLLSEIEGGCLGEAGGGLLDPAVVRRFLTLDPASGRYMGFDAPSGPTPSCGSLFSDRTAGHLGFTGVSFWMDLTRRAHVVLLTNRVHPTVENEAVRAFRPRIHDAAMRAILGR